MRELSYVSPNDPAWKRWTIAAIEDLSGRRGYLPLYRRWLAESVNGAPSYGEALNILGVRLKVDSPAPWPPRIAPTTPLIMIGNHPFGIGDGIASLALAEKLGRPFRVLINNDLLKVPEIRPYSLPIDFAETREAQQMNLASRAEARRLLKEGVTIIIFPSGGVATASNPFGRAEELPWKQFTARLVQMAEASVLPIYFEGQNSMLFHLVSRLSLTLRLSLLVSEFRYFRDIDYTVRVGEVVPFSSLRYRDDRRKLTEELYLSVHRLAPWANGKADAELLPTPADKRASFAWE